MQSTPPYNDILEDETLAPLKRNHACLQCKKRKVKCDAVHPTCNPCLRSHAHALRSAQRNKTRPPPLVCSYAEDDDEAAPGGAGEVEAERKRVSSAASNAKRAAVGNGVDRKLSREKELRAAEERETLKARIAELEARIAGLTTPSADTSRPNDTSNSANDWSQSFSELPKSFKHTAFPTPPSSAGTLPPSQLQSITFPLDATASDSIPSFDFSNILILPAQWPRNLPSPPILEHLIETFFQCEPQTPRMIHRPTLLTRIKLPPTHRDFPFPALLHAICAAAAPHTAWTVTIPPDQLEKSRFRHIAMGLDLETAEDFATAQCEAAERCIRHGTMSQMIGSGHYIFDIVRAHLLLSYTYLSGGMALRAWISSGTPGRLIKALEIHQKNKRHSVKPALMGDPKDDIEREERLATIWLAYLTESGFSVNSCWGQSFTLHDIAVALPASTDDFNHLHDLSGRINPNPQAAHDHDIMSNHPVSDPYVLAVKASFLLGSVSHWNVSWNQRNIRPNDEMDGLTWPSFIKLNEQITTFQSTVPVTLRNIYRLVDAGDMSVFDSNVLSVHIFPNVALIIMHEPFVEWEKPEESESLRVLQRAFEAVTGLLHLVPTQLDVSQVFTPFLMFSVFTIGRTIIRFIVRARKMEQFASAMRWRTDYQAILNLYKRYATKHVVGAHLIQYLDNHEVMYEGGILASEMVEACQAVHPPYAQILEGHAGQSTSTSTSDVEFLPSLVSSAPSASTSGTSPNVQSTGQTPESLHSEGQAACANLCAQADNLAQATQQAQQSVPQPNVGADGTNFDPLQFLNPMDPTAIDQVAAMISGTHGQGLDKQANHPELSEQFMNDMLLASSLGQNGFSWN